MKARIEMGYCRLYGTMQAFSEDPDKEKDMTLPENNDLIPGDKLEYKTGDFADPDQNDLIR